MTEILKGLLRKLTPWYDPQRADEREQIAKQEVERNQRVRNRAEKVINSYMLVDAIYHKRQNRSGTKKDFTWKP